MPEASNGVVTLAYEEEGPADGEPLLLVMGLNGQMTGWRPGFRAKLTGRGFRVLRFDNRDVGLSTWLDDAGIPDLIGGLAGKVAAPYTIEDMAADAVAVLDAAGIASAHLVGVSMGGMISQAVAIGYPERVRSLTSIMSTTGQSSVGQPDAEVLHSLFATPPPDRDGRIEHALRGSRLISSPGYPFDEDEARDRIAADYDRAYHPAGAMRQTAAIVLSPDRTPGLQKLDLPALVIHGEADRLINVSGGRATADAIPGARLLTIPGMGHDLPVGLYDTVVDAIVDIAGI